MTNRYPKMRTFPTNLISLNMSPPALLTIGGHVRTLSIGTWAWSPSATWGKAPAANTDEHTNAQAFRAAIDAGCSFFDTAEVYGESEERIGRYIQALPSELQPKVVIASKYIPLPWHFRSSNVVSHLQASLARMGLKKMSLYQIHGPALSIRPVETWAHGLADALDMGLCDQVGVSNYNSDQVARTVKVLEGRGHKLASNQVSPTSFSCHKPMPQAHATCPCHMHTHTHLVSRLRSSSRYSSADPRRLACWASARTSASPLWPILH